MSKVVEISANIRKSYEWLFVSCFSAEKKDYILENKLWKKKNTII